MKNTMKNAMQMKSDIVPNEKAEGGRDEMRSHSFAVKGEGNDEEICDDE